MIHLLIAMVLVLNNETSPKLYAGEVYNTKLLELGSWGEIAIPGFVIELAADYYGFMAEAAEQERYEEHYNGN